MKTTKELIIADITAKVEAKLASQKVELSLVDDIKSDVSANGKSADIARPLILQASTSLSKAYENLLNIKKRNEVIIKNSEVFKSIINGDDYVFLDISNYPIGNYSVKIVDTETEPKTNYDLELTIYSQKQ